VLFVDRTHADLVPPGTVAAVQPLDAPLPVTPAPLPAVREEDPAALLYTGGTTGRPKGVLLSHRAQLLNQYHAQMVQPVEPGWRYLQHTPMYHAGASVAVLRAGMTGGTVVLSPTFEAGAFLADVERHEIAFTVLLPTLITLILGHPDFRPERLKSLRRIAYGGSPMPRALLERLQGLLPELECTQVYGMTESCSGLTFLTAADHRRGGAPLSSVGRPFPGVRLEIRDPEGRPLPRGGAGEIWADAGNLMSGYHGRPDLTAEALVEGWYRTGDIGRLDEAGYLYLLDRAKDMIVTGGENVYGAEVEQAVASHPAVEQVAVVGVPDDTWGEAVCAVVRLRPGTGPVTEAEIRAHARRAVAGYKVPKRVVFRAEPFPLSGANKIAKRTLRDEIGRTR
jgi:long-chain acyl-CoA synthetase